MPIGSELQGALRSFVAVEREIVALGERADPTKAAEFVNMRRDLVMEFAKLGMALSNDPYLVANPDQMTQVTRLFSAFRAANSINQADWPAIRVRDNPEGYKDACRPVAERSGAFWQWVERELGHRR
ncbi:hypothetical protein [Sphingobium nicotianae]|uniref:Uncharacterized protein n=1 Tax=Sphingobium nicotianae TaxID=2782607 RepID=A0A9X1IQV3_9SPHN|nr:hypothetical protein [Sphingobium nicotianae]MBT2186988.1 hypothetical protein [Sphingobium nicotianae]